MPPLPDPDDRADEESSKVLDFVMHDENRMVESGNWRTRLLARLKLSVSANEEQ